MISMVYWVISMVYKVNETGTLGRGKDEDYRYLCLQSFELQLNVLKEAERSLDNTHLHNTDPKCSYLLIYLTRILIYPIDNKSILFFLAIQNHILAFSAI